MWDEHENHQGPREGLLIIIIFGLLRGHAGQRLLHQKC